MDQNNNFQNGIDSLPMGLLYNQNPSSNTTVYGVFDAITALIIFIFGYFFINIFFSISGGLPSFIFVTCFTLFSGTVMILKLKKTAQKPKIYSCLMLAVYFSVGAFFLISPDSSLSALVMFFYLISYPIWYYYTFSAKTVGIGDGFFYDAVKSVFVMPFGSFLNIFPALFSPITKKGCGKKVGYIIAGVLIAVIPSAVVLGLLLDSDAAFGSLVEKIAHSIIGNSIFEAMKNCMAFLYSIPVSMYLYGMLHSCTRNKYTDILSCESQSKRMENMSRIPVLIVASAMIPLCLIYLLFFFSQLGYYLDAFSSMIPEGYSASEYARSGFFQLVTVAFINLIAIISASLCSKKELGKQHTAIKILNIVISCFTLVLIATAIRKMALYISLFGLTRLRVVTTLFMAVLALIFVFIIIRQLCSRFNAVKASVIAAVVMTVLVSTVNIDARIAQFNVYMYLDGKHEKCDVSMFYELSYSAAEYVIPLIDAEDQDVSFKAREYLGSVRSYIDKSFSRDDGWKFRTPNLVRLEALLSEKLG